MSKKQTRRKTYDPLRGPVAAALARKDLHDKIVTTATRCYLTGSHERCEDLLADLMIIIATCCEAGLITYGREPWVSRLHAGLRNIQAVCLEHEYRWQSSLAGYFHDLLVLCEQHMFNVDKEAFVKAHHASQWAANIVRNRQVKPNMIASVEDITTGAPT